MKFQKGDKIVVPNNLESHEDIRTYVVKKDDGSDYIDVEEHGKIHRAFAFPYAYLNELTVILRFRENLAKQLRNSMKLVYELRNKISLEQLNN